MAIKSGRVDAIPDVPLLMSTNSIEALKTMSLPYSACAIVTLKFSQ